jgi:hypothetical protein
MTVRAVPKLSRYCKRIGGGKPAGPAGGLQRATARAGRADLLGKGSPPLPERAVGGWRPFGSRSDRRASPFAGRDVDEFFPYY